MLGNNKFNKISEWRSSEENKKEREKRNKKDIELNWKNKGKEEKEKNNKEGEDKKKKIKGEEKLIKRK